jgi:magnesium chelatase family protein
VSGRPFRAPHHTISDVGLLGGGTHPGPGEISLAHNGVLFLDELPEYRRSTLEVLRQPLEDGRVTISRAAGTYNFSSKFLLVCALNPCPCGFFGDPVRLCRCSPRQVESYRAKISGPHHRGSRVRRCVELRPCSRGDSIPLARSEIKFLLRREE